MTAWTSSAGVPAGVSAFPLTPLVGGGVDHQALALLIRRLVSAGVDSICVLGSTGSFAYLDRGERRAVIETATREANGIPVIAGIGALRTSWAQALADDAHRAGASGLLLPPVSYQPLTDDEVLGLYTDVTAGIDLPLVVYDNPGTTRVTFTPQLYAALGELPHVASIKIPPTRLPQLTGDRGVDLGADRAAIATLREHIPEHISLGISGDALGVRGLLAGCDLWYTALGGTVPGPVVAMAEAARHGHRDAAQKASDRLAPIWELFELYGGSLRVIAAIARLHGLVQPGSLPAPLEELSDRALDDVAHALDASGLAPPRAAGQ